MNLVRSGLAAVLGLVLLSACGSDDSGDPGGSAGAAASGGQGGAGGPAGMSGSSGLSGSSGQAGISGSSGQSGAAGSSGQGGEAGAAGVSGAAGGGGAAGGAAGQGTGGSPQALRSALDADGFDAQDGVFSFLDLSSCCETSCLGNNPSSPYGAFYVPPAPGQTVTNPNPDAQGRSPLYRLRADEALVYVGVTPPKSRYFGYTPYLSQRTEGGKVVQALASLSETLNNDVIGVDGPDAFGRPTVVIASLDQGVDARIRAALVAAGYPAGSLNSLVFDPTKSRPGLDAESDVFSILFRMAVFDDPAQGEAYRQAPPGLVLRVTPRQPATPQPFASPPPRPKDFSTTEASLTASVDALEAAILKAYPDHTGKVMVTTKGEPDPDACIAGMDACAYDNRDTIYPATIPQKLLDEPGEFLIVYGVNHETTGKASYGSASVYSLEHLFGVASVTSADYAGSAEAYLPGNPDAPKLYAWKIARDCAGDAACLEIPVGACPGGLPLGTPISIAFRIYLEPSSGTAADPSTLVIDRVMKFSKK